jgi:hypothetical protein
MTDAQNSAVEAVAILTPRQMLARLAVHSARAEPIIPDGWQAPNGYVLHGPRGRLATVCVDHNGNVPTADVGLFCESIAYVDRRLAKVRP